MCGIMAAALRQEDVSHALIQGLQALEYRGYDSAGVAVRDDAGQINAHRVVGKVRGLRARLGREPLQGSMGIAHTRWATHGAVEEANAHPHSAGEQIFVVHNGIVENYLSLRKLLEWEGYEFESETDSEVLTKLIHFRYAGSEDGQDMPGALRQVMAEVQGSYALVALVGPEAALYGCLHGCPLVLGRGQDGERYLSSDMSALVGHASEVAYLHDGDIVKTAYDQTQAWQAKNAAAADLRFEPAPPDEYISGKGNYQHYIQKEIHDQPEVVQNVLAGMLSEGHVAPEGLGSVREVLAGTAEMHLVGCGSAYYACMLGAGWLREIGGIPASAHVASEFRHASLHPRDDTLLVAVSQSGETADTLGILATALGSGYLSTLTLCNVAWSTMTRRAEHVILTKAGREVSVLSTKAITAQALSLLLLAISLRRLRQPSPGPRAREAEKELSAALLGLSAKVDETLQLCKSGVLVPWIERLEPAKSIFFVGRGQQYAVACEGALKLKEGSYIPAEAYPAGELKHGPLALIDPKTPTVGVVGSNPEVAAKTISNLSEIAARQGRVMLVAPEGVDLSEAGGIDIDVIRTPAIHPALEPFLQIVVMQNLAYQTALRLGTDIDQPRNLAKSVTVE